jgi:hypothetical protein
MTAYYSINLSVMDCLSISYQFEPLGAHPEIEKIKCIRNTAISIFIKDLVEQTTDPVYRNEAIMIAYDLMRIGNPEFWLECWGFMASTEQPIEGHIVNEAINKTRQFIYLLDNVAANQNPI